MMTASDKFTEYGTRIPTARVPLRRSAVTNLYVRPSAVAMAGIPLTAAQAELMGTLRLMQLAEKHGITSGTVLRGVVMWGEILDSINHPPCRCKNCPEPVVWDSLRGQYVHSGRPITSDQWCLTKAGAVAERSN